MPGWRRTLSVAATMLALLPAAASAQSAGDEQYEDPFGDEQPQSQATPAPAPAAEPTQSEATPAPAAPAQPAPAPGPAPAQLPRTGGDARLPALLGLVLLSAGVALRAHARRHP
jgi:hypothetical protein